MFCEQADGFAINELLSVTLPDDCREKFENDETGKQARFYNGYVVNVMQRRKTMQKDPLFKEDLRSK